MYAAFMPINVLNPYGTKDYFTNSLARFLIYIGYFYIIGTDHQKQKSDGQENTAKYLTSQRECVREVSYHQDYSVSL